MADEAQPAAPASGSIGGVIGLILADGKRDKERTAIAALLADPATQWHRTEFKHTFKAFNSFGTGGGQNRGRA